MEVKTNQFFFGTDDDEDEDDDDQNKEAPVVSINVYEHGSTARMLYFLAREQHRRDHAKILKKQSALRKTMSQKNLVASRWKWYKELPFVLFPFVIQIILLWLLAQLQVEVDSAWDDKIAGQDVVAHDFTTCPQEAVFDYLNATSNDVLETPNIDQVCLDSTLFDVWLFWRDFKKEIPSELIEMNATYYYQLDSLDVLVDEIPDPITTANATGVTNIGTICEMLDTDPSKCFSIITMPIFPKATWVFAALMIFYL